MMSREGGSSPFSAGAVIAKKYRLIQRLGDGSMGVVWHARHEPSGADCALKLVVRPSPDLRVRLLCEAQACSELLHDNIVRVHEIGETGSGDPFLVMDLLRGETLADLLARRKRLEVPEAARIGRDVARALEYAHAKGMIHRDLRPANVFLDEGPGRSQPPIVKVLDFGVGKNLHAASLGRTVATATLGSPAYMSPEQALAQTDIDGRTDVWSLGVMLFEMLSGGRPFEGEPLEVMQKVVSGPIPLLWHKVRYIHPGLSGLVMSCLRRNREDRPWPVAEIVRRLDTFATPARRPAQAPLPPPNPPPRKVSPESITTPRIERRRVVPPPLPVTGAESTLTLSMALADTGKQAVSGPGVDTGKQALSALRPGTAGPAEAQAMTGAATGTGPGAPHARETDVLAEAGAQAPVTAPVDTPSLAALQTPRVPPEDAALRALREVPEEIAQPAVEPARPPVAPAPISENTARALLPTEPISLPPALISEPDERISLPDERISLPAAPSSQPDERISPPPTAQRSPSSAPTSQRTARPSEPGARTSLSAEPAWPAAADPVSSKPVSSTRRTAPSAAPQATKTPLSGPSPARAPAVDLASLVRTAEAGAEKPPHHLHRGATIAAAAMVTIAVFAVAMFAVESPDRSGAGSEAMCPADAALSASPSAPGRVPADASLPRDTGPSPDRAAPSTSPPAQPSASMTPANPGALTPPRPRSRFGSALTPPPGWPSPGRPRPPAPRP